MKRSLVRFGALVIASSAMASPVWAHPSTGFHVHAGEVAGLLVVSLIVVGLLAVAGKRVR